MFIVINCYIIFYNIELNLYIKYVSKHRNILMFLYFHLAIFISKIYFSKYYEFHYSKRIISSNKNLYT